MDFNLDDHIANRNNFPPEKLGPYYGKHVAWSLDGKEIVAGHADPQKLCEVVIASGRQSKEVVLSYVPFPDEMLSSGGIVSDAHDLEASA